MYACSIFSLNPTPINANAVRRLPILLLFVPLNKNHAASRRVNTSSASILFVRLTAAATGVVAMTRAAIRAAALPKVGFTSRYTSNTEPTPPSACGKITLQPCSPKISALSV
ncbi:hypothetical protein D3C78_1286850 [compost metagenome]